MSLAVTNLLSDVSQPFSQYATQHRKNWPVCMSPVSLAPSSGGTVRTVTLDVWPCFKAHMGTHTADVADVKLTTHQLFVVLRCSVTPFSSLFIEDIL